MDDNVENFKNCNFYQKIDKICYVKLLKTIPLPPETMQQPIINPLRRFP